MYKRILSRGGGRVVSLFAFVIVLFVPHVVHCAHAEDIVEYEGFDRTQIFFAEQARLLAVQGGTETCEFTETGDSCNEGVCRVDYRNDEDHTLKEKKCWKDCNAIPQESQIARFWQSYYDDSGEEFEDAVASYCEYCKEDFNLGQPCSSTNPKLTCQSMPQDAMPQRKLQTSTGASEGTTYFCGYGACSKTNTGKCECHKSRNEFTLKDSCNDCRNKGENCESEEDEEEEKEKEEEEEKEEETNEVSSNASIAVFVAMVLITFAY